MIVRIDPQSGPVWLRLDIQTICVWAITLGHRGVYYASAAHPPSPDPVQLSLTPSALININASWILTVFPSATDQPYTGLIELVQASTQADAETTTNIIYSSDDLPIERQPKGTIKTTDKTHLISGQLYFLEAKALLAQLVEVNL